MSYRSPLYANSGTDGTLFDLFRSLFVLFLVLGTFRVVNIEMIRRVSNTMRPIPDPVLVGTAVYAGVGLVVLGAVFVLWRRRRSPEECIQRGPLVRSGGVAAVSLVAFTYLLHRSTTLPVFPREFLIGVSDGLVVMGLIAMRYSRVHGIDVPLSVPDRAYWASALGTAVLSAVTAVGGTYLNMRTVETIPTFRFDRAAMGGVWPVEFVLFGVFLGAGWGLLIHGAIQTRLRDRLGTAGGATATAALSAFPLVVARALDLSVWELGAISRAALLVAENFLLVVIALALVQGVWLFCRHVGLELTPVRGVAAVVLVAAVVSLAIEALPFVPLTVVSMVVAALATVGYERSGSVWVPVAAYVSYNIFATIEAVRFLVGVPV